MSSFQYLASKVSGLSHIRFLCPSALKQSVTLNFGMVMPAWFDIKGLSADAPEDASGVQQTAQYIGALIDREVRQSGIPSERIVVAGFSQGGSIALYVGLTSGKKLGGILGMSTFVVCRDHVLKNLSNNGLTSPLLMCHGNEDPLVQFTWGQLSFMAIKQIREERLGKDKSACEFKAYPGLKHSANVQELNDVAQWLQKVLPQQ